MSDDEIKKELILLANLLEEDDLAKKGALCHSFVRCVEKTKFGKLFTEDELDEMWINEG